MLLNLLFIPIVVLAIAAWFLHAKQQQTRKQEHFHSGVSQKTIPESQAPLARAENEPHTIAHLIGLVEAYVTVKDKPNANKYAKRLLSHPEVTQSHREYISKIINQLR